MFQIMLRIYTSPGDDLRAMTLRWPPFPSELPHTRPERGTIFNFLEELRPPPDGEIGGQYRIGGGATPLTKAIVRHNAAFDKVLSRSQCGSFKGQDCSGEASRVGQ